MTIATSEQSVVENVNKQLFIGGEWRDASGGGMLGRRRVLDGERIAARGVAPLAPYEELLVYAIYYALLGGCDAHRSSFLCLCG